MNKKQGDHNKHFGGNATMEKKRVRTSKKLNRYWTKQKTQWQKVEFTHCSLLPQDMQQPLSTGAVSVTTKKKRVGDLQLTVARLGCVLALGGQRWTDSGPYVDYYIWLGLQGADLGWIGCKLAALIWPTATFQPLLTLRIGPVYLDLFYCIIHLESAMIMATSCARLRQQLGDTIFGYLGWIPLSCLSTK